MQSSIIHKDDEICCRNCGSVLAHEDMISENTEPKTMSMELYVLGSALQKNISLKIQKTPEQYHEENALRFISGLVKRYDLPEAFIMDVFGHLKKKNHLQSKTEPVKQLLKILSKDENYIHIHKYRKLKADLRDGKVTSN